MRSTVNPLLAPSNAILFQEGVSVKLRLPQDNMPLTTTGGNCSRYNLS